MVRRWQEKMDKIVGRLSCLLAIFLFFGLQAELVMEITSFDGHKITQAAAGEAFIVKLSLDNVDAAQDIQIKGLKDFAVKKTGYSLITVNGEKTAQITYQVRIDRPGSYLIGPAYSPSTKERSGNARIKIVAERVTQTRAPRNGKTDKQSNGQVLLRLWVDKDTVFVGQKVKTVLRLYFAQSDDISVEQIVSNDPDTIELTEKKGPKKGVQEIDGKEFVFLEWQWHMYPTEPGKLVIPAYFVDYSKQLPMQNGLGSFAIFFGPRYERKRVYSNALSLQVRPLPDENRSVDAVGSFLSYNAKISPAVAKKYEGMVLTLSIEGEGNMIGLKEPVLQGMPEAFKYYPSKNYIEETPFGQKKAFEYIVQGMQDGDWEIPEQTFTYFDVDGRTYKSLSTTSLFVSVLPGHAQLPQQGAEPACDIASDDKDGLAPLAEHRIAHEAMSQDGFSLGWFIFILLMPLIVTLIYMFGFRSGWLVQKLAPRYIKRRAFVMAQKQLSRAYRYHDTRVLHGIFMQLFAHRLSVPSTSLTKKKIEEIIAQSSWSDETKKDWQIFYDKIAQAAYAGTAGPKEVLRLFHEAAQWIAELERILK